jgi:hypothetical protein
LESGDIVVTDQNAKALSQPKPSGKPAPQAAATSAAAVPVTATSATASFTANDGSKRTVRTVGPPFLSSQSSSPAAPQSQ